MAFGQAENTNNQSEKNSNNNFARYTGVGVFQVLAVNPTKEELGKIYGRELTNDFEYFTTKDGVKQAEFKFVVKYFDESGSINMIDRIVYFVSDKKNVNKDNTKAQVIDKYGRTAWATSEEIKAKKIPQYSNGPAELDTDYRIAYVGEVDLTNFIKAFLGITDVMIPKKQSDGTWKRVEIENKSLAECRFEESEIKAFFSGNIKAVTKAINISPNNKFKALVGVKSGSDNKLYQTFAKEAIIKYNTSDKGVVYNTNQVKKRIDNGGYQDVDFGDFINFKQYEVKPTDFVAQDASEDVFGGAPAVNNPQAKEVVVDDPWGAAPAGDNQDLPF